MSINLIPKVCPKCNAPIKFSAYDNEVTCSRCHIEFEIERKAEGISLNQKARCPLGNGNDRIYKLTGIKRNKTMMDSRGYKFEPLLVSQIKRPQEPNLYNFENIDPSSYRFEMIKNLFLALLFWAAGSYAYFFTPLWKLCFLVPFISGYFVYRAQNEQRIYDYKNQNHNQWLANENQRLENEYNFAITKYEKLYYCETHDEIFNMKTKAHFKVDRLQDYLYPNHFR